GDGGDSQPEDHDEGSGETEGRRCHLAGARSFPASSTFPRANAEIRGQRRALRASLGGENHEADRRLRRFNKFVAAEVTRRSRFNRSASSRRRLRFSEKGL